MLRIYSAKNWKFLFHRMSGLILLIYFMLHVLSISTALLFGQEVFDSVMKNKLESLYSDLGWGAVVLNQNINRFFKF